MQERVEPWPWPDQAELREKRKREQRDRAENRGGVTPADEPRRGPRLTGAALADPVAEDAETAEPVTEKDAAGDKPAARK